MTMSDEQLGSTAANIAEQWLNDGDVWSLFKRLPDGYSPDVAYDSSVNSMESLIRVRKLYCELHAMMSFDLDRVNLPADKKSEFLEELKSLEETFEQLVARIESDLAKAVINRAITESYRRA